MAKLLLDHISKSYNTTTVLTDINLTVKDGEFMVLVGPSGCGKSTLLRLIAGLDTPTHGSIYLNDRQIDSLPPKSRDVAMVFQSYALYPHLNVHDNIAFGLRRQQRKGWILSRQSRGQINQKVTEVADLLQIAPLLHRKPGELSGGQKQRVALGRAIARNPQVFLMDEPLSNLDAQLRHDTRSQLVSLQRTLQVTTLYVTHDQTEAMTMGSRIAVLHHGKLQQVDTPLHLYRYPANQFVAHFLGSPPINFLPCQWDGSQLWSEDFYQPLPATLDLPPRSVILGIRPEHLYISPPATAHWAGRLQRIEHLGVEAHLHINLSGSDLTLRASEEQALPYRPGDRIFVAAHPPWHLFDPETQEKLISTPDRSTD